MAGHLTTVRTEEYERLRSALESATWLLEGAAECIDEWFPEDKEPVVQADLRRFARQWQQEFALRPAPLTPAEIDLALESLAP